MSTTAVGKILKEAGGATDNKKNAVKEAKQRTEEIVKELVNDQATESAPKRKPGRPPKSASQSPGRSKTPPPHFAADKEPPPMFTPQTEMLSPAEKLLNQIHIRRLMLYQRKFPEYAKFFEGYNPVLHHPVENEKILEAFKELIHSEIEFETAPAAITGIISGMEQSATAWAIENPGTPGAKVVEDLQGVSDAVLKNRAVSLDIRLLECEVTGILPKNPRVRLLLNSALAIFKYWSFNRANNIKRQHQPDPSDTKPGPKYDKL